MSYSVQVPLRVIAARPPGTPRRTPLFAPIDTMADAGRRVLRFHLDRMISCETGTRQGQDIEALHDMRVATRRLRVACRVFGRAFGKKALVPFRTQLSPLAADLGAVRDFDVFIEFVESSGREHGESGPAGLDALVVYLQQEREAPRTQLIHRLDSTEYTVFKRQFSAWLDGAGEEAGPRSKDGRRKVRKAAPALLDRRLSRVRAYRKQLEDPPRPETLHRLRIICKRLRYTVEFFRDCYDGRLDGLIDRMVELQDVLGRFHDADVRVAFLTNYMGRLDRRSARARQTQRAVQMLIESERQVQQESLTRFWKAWNEARPEFRAFDFTL